MSRYLKILQTVAMIGKIFSLVVFILCIVGGVGCLLGLVALLAVGEDPEVVKALQDFAIEGAEEFAKIETLYFACISGLLACAGEAVIAKFAQKYFENELQAGTPFTVAGAKEMLRLGILSLAIPVGLSVVVTVIWGIFSWSAGLPETSDFNISIGGGGLFCLLLSAIFFYGAEVAAKKPPAGIPADPACVPPSDMQNQ